MNHARAVVGRLLVWVPLYVALGLVGRLTVIDGGSLSLVWPAAGVGALWLASATRRTLPYDVAALAASVFLVNHLTGASLALAAVFVAANLGQGAMFVLMVRRLSPHLFLFGGRDPVAGLRDLGVLVGASAVGSTVGAGTGAVGFLALGLPISPMSLLVWWGRNNTGLVLVAVLGLLVLHRVGVLTGALDPPAGVPVRRSRVEVAALWLISSGLLLLVFGRTDVLPLSFMMLFSTVLVAVRLGPVSVALHAVVLGASSIVFTLAGRGPFAGIADLSERALVAQLFVTMAVVTGLVLTFSRLERDRATWELGQLQVDTADRALLLGSILEHMREGLTVIDAHGEVIVSNRAGDRLLGRAVEERIDAGTAAQTYGLTHLDGTSLAAEEMHYVRAVAGEVFQEDVLLTRPDADEPIVLEITGGPLPTDPAETPRAVITFRDVTALRHDRDALATFAGVVAHDLKRPLTVISGWTDALTDDLTTGRVEPAAALSMLARVSGAADQMGRLLDDLLHYTVVRDAPVRLQPVDVSAAAEDAARVFRERDTAPRITVVPGVTAQADPVMLRQVLDNLIGNAVKYVGPGVRPEVRIEGRHDAGTTVVTVTDNGIGIPEADRRRVFESFQRAHGDDYRGTGLGLAIVHRAVERCGGSVTVRHNPTGGSVFEVRLPAAAPTAPTVIPEVPATAGLEAEPAPEP